MMFLPDTPPCRLLESPEKMIHKLMKMYHPHYFTHIWVYIRVAVIKSKSENMANSIEQISRVSKYLIPYLLFLDFEKILFFQCSGGKNNVTVE